MLFEGTEVPLIKDYYFQLVTIRISLVYNCNFYEALLETGYLQVLLISIKN